jgi:hypothetical protein
MLFWICLRRREFNCRVKDDTFTPKAFAAWDKLMNDIKP